MRTWCRRLDASAPFHHLTVGVIIFAAVLIGFETNADLVRDHLVLFTLMDRAVLGFLCSRSPSA